MIQGIDIATVFNLVRKFHLTDFMAANLFHSTVHAENLYGTHQNGDQALIACVSIQPSKSMRKPENEGSHTTPDIPWRSLTEFHAQQGFTETNEENRYKYKYEYCFF